MLRIMHILQIWEFSMRKPDNLARRSQTSSKAFEARGSASRIENRLGALTNPENKARINNLAGAQLERVTQLIDDLEAFIFGSEVNSEVTAGPWKEDLPAQEDAGHRREVEKPVTLSGDALSAALGREESLRRLHISEDDETPEGWVDTDTLGALETAERLGVVRTTLSNWRKSYRVISFRKGLRNFVYPERQFNGNRPVEGVSRILPLFNTSEEAWDWLITGNRYTCNLTPLERLKAGHIDEVCLAAEGRMDYE